MTAAEYRESADEARQAMRAATSPELRAELLRLALRWDERAERAEQPRRAA